MFSSFGTRCAQPSAICPHAGRSAFEGIARTAVGAAIVFALATLALGCVERVSHLPQPEEQFECRRHIELHRRLSQAASRAIPEERAEARTERAVLRGLAWLARFGDDDRRFDAVLSDYTLTLAELTLVGSPRSRRLAKQLLDAEIARAEARFPAPFPPTIDGKWAFITVTWAAALAGRPLARYRELLRGYFPPLDQLPDAPRLADAIARRDYDILGDALIDGSFADDLRRLRPQSHAWVPDPRLPALLRRLDELALEHTRFSNPPAYHRQLYFVTHVVLAASAYGRRALPRSRLLARLRETLVVELPIVGETSRDIDLLAEMLQCLLLYPPGQRGPEAELEATRRVLLKRQRADGSWRQRGDATHSPYLAMHGTWAATAALATWISSQAKLAHLRRCRREPKRQRLTYRR